jgi:3-(3-hydroxy-phenyl)propionate hydroxylase
MHDVVIAGGGPVGLTAAVGLLREGASVTVCEAKPELVRLPRASTFHPPTLEMLDELGLADPMIARGYRVDRIQYRERQGGVVAEFDYGLLAGETRFPFRLQCPQDELAEIAAGVVDSHQAGQLRFDTRIVGVTQRHDHVAVTTDTGDRIEARWVIGADGAGSAVRHATGIAFDGMTYGSRNLQLITRFDFPSVYEDLGLVNYIFDPDEWCVIMRTPPAVWRVLFPLDPDEPEERALDDGVIQQRLRRLTHDAGTPVPVEYKAVYRVHQRVAARFLDGRVLLAGDAAHVNSPLGGMGMNSGIHDVCRLRRPLAAALRGDGDRRDLERWAERRREVAQRFVGRVTDRNSRHMSQRDPEARRTRNEELAAQASDPEAHRRYLRTASMLDAVSACV